MTKKSEPALGKIKFNSKPIKLFPKISLFKPQKKLDLRPAVKLQPKKDENDDGLPES